MFKQFSDESTSYLVRFFDNYRLLLERRVEKAKKNEIPTMLIFDLVILIFVQFKDFFVIENIR